MRKTYNFLVNDQISASQVRIIDEEGNFVGIQDIKDAISIALSKNLDLIQVQEAKNDQIPLCKIDKLSSFIAKNKKRQKMQKSSARTLSVKEIRIRPAISKHDLSIKINNAIRFLNKGHKLIWSMRLRGREIMHYENSKTLLQGVIETLQPYSNCLNEDIKLVSNQIILKFDPAKNAPSHN